MKLIRSVYMVLGATVVASPAYANGLPQMDQSWYPNQLLWLAISFTLLYALVSLFIAPTAAKILNTRETAISEAILEAEKATRAAETTKTAFESGGQSARTQASEVMLAAQVKNSTEAAAAMAKLDHELARKLEQAEARIHDARDTALGVMQEATVSLARTMASMLLGREITEQEASAAISPIVKLKKAS